MQTSINYNVVRTTLNIYPYLCIDLFALHYENINSHNMPLAIPSRIRNSPKESCSSQAWSCSRAREFPNYTHTQTGRAVVKLSVCNAR